MSIESQAAELLATIREMDDYRTSSGYYIGRAVAGLLDLLGDRKAVTEMVLSELKVKLNSSQVSKYAAYGKLPDDPATRKLSLTRAYELARQQTDGWQEDALRAADPTDPYTWSAFDADWLGKVPPEEVPMCVCPDCGKLHRKGEQ